MLSNAQFGQLASEAPSVGPDDGGFTVKHTTGYRPQSGYAVALAGTERVHPTAELTGDHIKSYAQDHDASLRQHGTYLGAWSPAKDDEGHGSTFLDNTRIRHTRKAAVNHMVMENQFSMYNLGTKETVPNVFRQKPTTFTEPAGFDREGFERDVADKYRAASGRRSLSADEGQRRAGGA